MNHVCSDSLTSHPLDQILPFFEQLGNDSNLERSLDEPCMFRQSDIPPLGPNTTILEQLGNDSNLERSLDEPCMF